MEYSDFGIIGKNSIATDNGNKKASEIKIGDRIISGCGFNKIVFSEIKNIVKRKYNNFFVFVKTHKNKKLYLSKNQLIFSKFDIRNKYYFVFLAKNKDGYYIGTFKSRISIEKHYFIPDHYWIIDVFEKEEEAVYFQKLISYSFGIPDYEKNALWLKLNVNNIRNIFKDIDTSKRALKLMNEYFICADYFYRINSKLNSAGLLNLIFYGSDNLNNAKSSYDHRLLVNKTPETAKNIVSRFTKRTQKNLWIVDASKKNRLEIIQLSEALSTLDNLEIIKYCQLTDNSPFLIIPATHLKKGMKIAILDTDKIIEETIESVDILKASSTNSYKFEFDDEYNNLVVNNIFVHK